MSIKGLLSRIFKKRSIVANTLVLLDINNIIDIPTRKKYKGQDIFLKQIDEYKKEYKELLSSKETITSINLHSTTLKEKRDILLDILTNSYFKEGGITSLEVIDEEVTLFANVNHYKLLIYKNELDRLQIEIELRLIALDELSKEINKSKSHNKNAVENEINNLAYSYLIYTNQQLAISNSIDSYISMLSNIKVDKDNYEEIRKAKLKRVKRYLKTLLPEIDKKLSNISDKDKELAFCEYYLEILAHDKEKIKEAKFQIRSIEREAQIDSLCDNETRKQLYKQIICAEPLIRTVYDYNKGEISEDEINTFYNAKYIVLTSHLEGTSPFMGIYDKYRDATEYTVYETIIQNKIERIVSGNISKIFNNKDILKFLTGTLKTNDIFDVDAILNNTTLLGLINLVTKYIPTYDEIIEYFDSMYVKVTDVLTKNNNEGILLDKKISIRSVCSLLGSYIGQDESIIKYISNTMVGLIESDNKFDINYYLCVLYSLLAPIIEDKETYYIPKGLRKITANDKRMYWISGRLYEIIEKNLDRRNIYEIVFPDTMEEFEIKHLNRWCTNSLILNEGLRSFKVEKILEEDYVALANYPERDKLEIRELVIPSTLETIDWNLFDLNELRSITFTNYKESKILKNRKLMKSLLKKCCKFMRKKEYNTSTKETIEKSVIASNITFELVDEFDNSYYVQELEDHSGWVNGLVQVLTKDEREKWLQVNEVDVVANIFYKKIEELTGTTFEESKKVKKLTKNH